MKYCAVNDRWNEFVIGETKSDLILKMVEFHLTDNWELVFKFPHYNKEKNISFSKETQHSHIPRLVIDYLYNEAHKYGWKMYEEI